MTKFHFFFLLSLVAGCNYSIPNVQDTATGNQTIELLPVGTIPGYQTIATEIITPKCCKFPKSGGFIGP